MKMISGASQKIDAMILAVDETVFTLFGADSPLLVCCFDYSLVLEVK